MPRPEKPLSQKQLAAAEFAVLRLEDLQALAQQALIRAARLETGLFTTCLPAPRTANYALSEGFHRMGRGIRKAESPAR